MLLVSKAKSEPLEWHTIRCSQNFKACLKNVKGKRSSLFLKLVSKARSLQQRGATNSRQSYSLIRPARKKPCQRQTL
jgi:hypothetical protein